MAIISPKKYEVYSYVPTKCAEALGDVPGEVEVVSEMNEEGIFTVIITDGIDNYTKRGRRELEVSVNSEFAKGMILLNIAPCVIDSGLCFEDLFQ